MAHATTMTHAPAFATGSYSSSGTPLGLGSSAPLMPSIAPKKGASGLRRKHTMAKFGKAKGGKARGDVTTNALLEVALAAVLNNANVVAENVSNEVVFQATMQVPMHHVMACRIEAYSTPFHEAPSIHATNLSEDDKQFAACIAAAPDIEEQPSMGLQRLASLLQQRPLATQQQAGASQQTAHEAVARGAKPSELTMTFSVRQRQGSVERSDSARYDGNDGEDAATAAGHALEGDDAARSASLRRSGSLAAPPRTALPPTHAANGAAATNAVAAAAAAAATAAAVPLGPGATRMGRTGTMQRPLSLLRIETLGGGESGAAARLRVELDAGDAPDAGARGVAALLGIGTLLDRMSGGRTAPASQLLNTQLRAFAGDALPHLVAVPEEGAGDRDAVGKDSVGI